MLSINTRTYDSRARRICQLIADGWSLQDALKEPGMPRLNTVRRWQMESPDFRRRYDTARKLRAERLVDEVVEIADALKVAPSDAETRRQRLRIDARKWAVAQAAKMTIADEDGEELPPYDFTVD